MSSGPTFDANGFAIVEKLPKKKPKIKPQARAPRFDTDVSLAPSTINAIRAGKRVLAMEEPALLSASLTAFRKALEANPALVAVRPGSCPACGRKFQYSRPPKGVKKRRLSCAFRQVDVENLEWISERYYHGVFSAALESALFFFLPEEVLPPGSKDRL